MEQERDTVQEDLEEDWWGGSFVWAKWILQVITGPLERMRKPRLREMSLFAQLRVKRKKLQVKWECLETLVWGNPCTGKGRSSHGGSHRPFSRAGGWLTRLVLSPTRLYLPREGPLSDP